MTTTHDRVSVLPLNASVVVVVIHSADVMRARQRALSDDIKAAQEYLMAKRAAAEVIKALSELQQ